MHKATATLLLLFSCSAFAQQAAKPTVQDEEFHDPFAAEEAQVAPKISDPLERMNRTFFHFNDKLYSWVLRPVAKGYAAVAPERVRESIDRFFTNVKSPLRLVNNVLEGRLKNAGIETTRFVVNSTVGVAGLLDPAADRWQIKARPADLDQTLAVYGVPTGIYLNWPFLGPSCVRGTVGRVGDAALNPVSYLNTPWAPLVAGGDKLNVLSLHTREYDAFRETTLDPYVALRSSYFERSANAAKR